MTQFDDAEALLQHAEKQLGDIRDAYEASLQEKKIKPELLIEIKNFLENLRSSLDFSAHALFALYGSSPKSNPNIYFPYATLNQGSSEYQQRIEVCIPGLSQSRPDIAAVLEGFQHYSDPNNRWLPLFMDLNNENKHEKLTPQTRRESKELRIKSGGSEVAIGPGASISLGPGASMKVGNMVIPGPQSFDSSVSPSSIGPGQKMIITWVSFTFSTNNEEVLPFLHRSLSGAKKIVHDLHSL
jgi:hypothetical protein